MKPQVCFEEVRGAWPIRLTQTGIDRFTVTYGLQVKKGLSYTEAALELGACLMHAAACDGVLDNRTVAEARRDGRAA